MASRCHASQAYLRIDHEAKHVLDVVKGQDTTIGAFPETLVVGTSALDGGPQLVDILGVCDSDLEVGTLHIALETVQVLTKDHLYRVDGRLMLGKMRFEVGLERLTVTLLE